ncbi:hypothetical protein P691DRAFT_807967 [Macrolepiota fuliginosa MF-IS2]|uniref:Uncharacterized protein n=1 Tax=Macrolepiota fuliginosa MF-IS2 TaxID=1400762 RepID=A0A9P6C716_9AGAR|nr:hypothetical protein P691DRAFT_807967 [Macrolepiota fuliginosa MF-IS2]
MLPRIPPCGLFPFKASSASRSIERATAVAIASKLGTLPSGMSGVENSVLIILCARAIASLGFGLSIFFIWLRWFLPVVPPIIPPIIPALDHGRRRPPSCLPGTPTSYRAGSQPVVNLDTSVTPLRRTSRGHARRVSFADSLRSEIGKTIDQDVTRADTTLFISPLPGELDSSTSASVSSTPTQSGSPSSTPALTPTSTLEDSTDHELEPPPPPRRSNSTSHLIPKIKSPFHTKNKRSSLPPSLLGEFSGVWFC